jgi:hypothetical protein
MAESSMLSSLGDSLIFVKRGGFCRCPFLRAWCSPCAKDSISKSRFSQIALCLSWISYLISSVEVTCSDVIIDIQEHSFLLATQ